MIGFSFTHHFLFFTWTLTFTFTLTLTSLFIKFIFILSFGVILYIFCVMWSEMFCLALKIILIFNKVLNDNSIFLILSTMHYFLYFFIRLFGISFGDLLILFWSIEIIRLSAFIDDFKLFLNCMKFFDFHFILE